MELTPLPYHFVWVRQLRALAYWRVPAWCGRYRRRTGTGTRSLNLTSQARQVRKLNDVAAERDFERRAPKEELETMMQAIRVKEAFDRGGCVAGRMGGLPPRACRLPRYLMVLMFLSHPEVAVAVLRGRFGFSAEPAADRIDLGSLRDRR